METTTSPWCSCDPLAVLREHQQGACAICGPTDQALVIDHDHQTGFVRGLLCVGCNVKEGAAKYRAEPSFVEYRQNPLAQQLGLLVQYGKYSRALHVDHLPTLVNGLKEVLLGCHDELDGATMFLGREIPNRELRFISLKSSEALVRNSLENRTGRWAIALPACDAVRETAARLKAGATAPEVALHVSELTQSDAWLVLLEEVERCEAYERYCIERTKSALDAKRRRGERIGGRKPTHTPEQVRRAINMLDTTDLTGQEVANAVGMSRSRMYALVARERAAS